MRSERQQLTDKAYRERNRERLAAYHKAWKAKNRDKVRSYCSAYAKRHPDRVNAKVKARYRAGAGQRERFARSLRSMGITAEDWARAYEAQHGKCAGCLAVLRWDRTTHMDHDHNTGRFRGLLCNDCNTSLGKLKENVRTLRRLVKYILKHRQLDFVWVPFAWQRQAPLRGERNPVAKLTARSVETIRAIRRAGFGSYSEIGAMFGCSLQTVSNICNNKSWRAERLEEGEA